MADITISDIAVLVTTLTSSDLLMAERVSDGVTVKITKANAIGATFTGGGTIATGGFTLTVPATGTVALLGTPNTFTRAQVISPSAVGDIGLVINMPASNTERPLRLRYAGTDRSNINIDSATTTWNATTFDAGAGQGPNFNIGRNSNASTASPGVLFCTAADNQATGLYPDNSGIWRTIEGAVTSATFAGGTVVGSQSSHIDYKSVLGKPVSDKEALAHIVAAAEQVKRFVYKSGAYNGEEFSGLVIDGKKLHRYGMDADDKRKAGKLLNLPNALGDLMLAVRGLAARVDALEKKKD